MVCFKYWLVNDIVPISLVLLCFYRLLWLNSVVNFWSVELPYPAAKHMLQWCTVTWAQLTTWLTWSHTIGLRILIVWGPPPHNPAGFFRSASLVWMKPVPYGFKTDMVLKLLRLRCPTMQETNNMAKCVALKMKTIRQKEKEKESNN